LASRFGKHVCEWEWFPNPRALAKRNNNKVKEKG